MFVLQHLLHCYFIGVNLSIPKTKMEPYLAATVWGSLLQGL